MMLLAALPALSLGLVLPPTISMAPGAALLAPQGPMAIATSVLATSAIDTLTDPTANPSEQCASHAILICPKRCADTALCRQSRRPSRSSRYSRSPSGYSSSSFRTGKAHGQSLSPSSRWLSSRSRISSSCTRPPSSTLPPAQHHLIFSTISSTRARSAAIPSTQLLDAPACTTLSSLRFTPLRYTLPRRAAPHCTPPRSAAP